MNTTSEQAMWPRRAISTTSRLPPRRSRTREASPRLRRPPKWSERLLPRRVA